MDKEEEEKLAKLGITSIPGRKSLGDRIYFWNGKQITFTELGTIYAELHKNETRNYPYGKGGKYLDEFLEDVRKVGEVTDEICKKYKLMK